MPRTKKTPITASKAEKAAKPIENAAEIKNEAKAVPAPAESPKEEANKPAVKKSAPKKAAKTTAKQAVKTAPAAESAKKKPGRKPKSPKPVTVEDIVAKLYNRIDKSAAKSIAAEGKAAVDIKLYGPFEAHMYIEIKNGTVNVQPYDYIEKDIEAAISVENALAIADGKLSVKEAVENGSLYVFGNVQFALMLAKLFG